MMTASDDLGDPYDPEIIGGFAEYLAQWVVQACADHRYETGVNAELVRIAAAARADAACLAALLSNIHQFVDHVRFANEENEALRRRILTHIEVALASHRESLES
jgi:hypothetical protein